MAAGVLIAVSSACGGSGSSEPSTPTGPSQPGAPASPSLTATVTITSSGVNPAEVTIAVGGRVTFVNNDVIPHDIAGGPDPDHPDCREIDFVGFLAPGQRRQTNVLPVARTCDYHDHSFHSPIFNGRIVIR